MRLLGINTATATTEIALVEGEKVIVEKSWPSSRDEAEKILPLLQEFLDPQKESHIKPARPIDKIFVVEGPGPFTALRLGVTIANTLSFVYQAAVVSCSTFEYLLRKIPAENQKNTAVILKAGANFFTVLMPATKEPKTIELHQLPQLFKAPSVRFLVGDLTPEDQQKISETIGIGWIEPKDLKTMGEVIRDMEHNPLPEYRMAEPRYLQPPKITQSKKKIFN